MAVGAEGNNDTLLQRHVNEDKVPWYRKKNLRLLYLIMFPTCIGIEMTSGYVVDMGLGEGHDGSIERLYGRFDSSMMNSLQAVDSWVKCECSVGFD